MPATFLTLLEESALAAIPATAQAMDHVSAHLETIRSQWDSQAPHLSVDELQVFRRRLRQVELLVSHAAQRRLGLARHMQALESGYTATGLAPQPQATSWECTG